MSRTALAVVLVVALATLGAGTSNQPQERASYEPPYEQGSSGGDEWNLLYSDDDGRVAAARVYPVPSVLSCDALAGWEGFEITHEATDEFDNVRLDLADVAIDPYTFISVTARDEAGEFIASGKVRGPLVEQTYTLDVPVVWNAEDGFEPQTVELQFGLELTSACPSADAGTVRFTSVSLQHTGPTPED